MWMTWRAISGRPSRKVAARRAAKQGVDADEAALSSVKDNTKLSALERKMKKEAEKKAKNPIQVKTW